MNEFLEQASMYQYEDSGYRPQISLYDADETKPYEFTEDGVVKMTTSANDSEQHDQTKEKPFQGNLSSENVVFF